MSFPMIGTINDYAKSWKLQTQWNLKQQQGDLTAHADTLSDWLEGPSTDSDSPYGEHGDTKLRKIHQKLEAGGTLTQREREYLQAKDPEAYQELVKLEKEQEAYERALKRCRTKEDVQRLKLGRVAASLTTVNAVEHNPNIGIADKLEICMREKNRCDRAEESTREFIRTGAYHRLPTEAEQAKALHDLHQAQRPHRPPQPEQTGQSLPLPEGTEYPTLPELVQPAPDTPTQAEAEASPEVQKVRRAQAAYSPFPKQTPEAPALNTRA